MIYGRESTAEEKAIFDRFADLVECGRSPIVKTITAARLLRDGSAFDPSNASGAAWTADDDRDVNDLVNGQNAFESYLSKLRSGVFYFRARGADLDVYKLPPEIGDLGGAPLILVVVGAIVVTAAITLYQSLTNKRAEIESSQKKRLATLDSWALKQPASVRADWIKFKEGNQGPVEKTIWQEIKSEGMGLIALAALAFILVRSLRSSSSEKKAE